VGQLFPRLPVCILAAGYIFQHTSIWLCPASRLYRYNLDTI
jgi:hypothetical protein